MASEEYLPVMLSTTRLLIKRSTVKEILGKTAFVSVPHATVSVPGVVPHGDTVIPLIDLVALTGQRAEPSGAAVRDRTVVVDDGDLTVALTVDKVREVIRVETGQVRECLQPIAPFAAREVELESHLHYVIDVDRLIEAARLTTASEEV